APDCVGPGAEAAVGRLEDGEVVLLENLRFHAGEEANDPDFAAGLARLGDLYVNDAFSTAHRRHASTTALASLLPAAAGRLMADELDQLARVLASPRRPLAALVGGAKVSTKLRVLSNLAAKVDLLAIGGAMANTFLLARGLSVGRSLCERELTGEAEGVLTRAEAARCRVLLPDDAVVARALEAGTAAATVAVDSIPRDMMVLDVGPSTVGRIGRELEYCRAVVWNGPFGASETPPFDRATVAIARIVARLTRAGRLLSVAGGGDTVAALGHAGVAGELSYVSTAGGAFLEWLEGGTLPGVAALEGSPPAEGGEVRSR
ncbi:MAG: phosphoglycerate kinase, partial [Alphaproteobacteria bacterium]